MEEKDPCTGSNIHFLCLGSYSRLQIIEIKVGWFDTHAWIKEGNSVFNTVNKVKWLIKRHASMSVKRAT